MKERQVQRRSQKGYKEDPRGFQGPNKIMHKEEKFRLGKLKVKETKDGGTGERVQ